MKKEIVMTRNRSMSVLLALLVNIAGIIILNKYSNLAGIAIIVVSYIATLGVVMSIAKRFMTLMGLVFEQKISYHDVDFFKETI